MTGARPHDGTTGTDGTAGDRDPPRDIAIVGGGICGLTTAVALEQRGLSPTVYEAASAYRPVGAGILLQTNAMLVFDRLGLADRIREAGVPLVGGGLRSTSGSFMTRFDLDAVERERFGYGFVAVHRADLQQILLDALSVEVRTDMDCVAVSSTDPPRARFDDGTTITPDLLIGADGIHSTVREAVAPGVTPRAIDAVAYRALVSVDLPSAYRASGFEVWGDGVYAGGAPIDGDRFYLFATVPERLTGPEAPPSAAAAALRERLAGYPRPIPAALDALNPEDIVVSALEDLPSLPTWSRGRVVLAGDAAHAMLPFAAQGAAQSIEDGPALADAVATCGTPAAAADQYQRARRSRADRVRRESNRLGRLGTMQSTVKCRLRNAAIRAVPDAVVRRLRRRQVAGTTLPG
ncbi:NAD(P)/FAD-dependent oxidoreductase [Halomicroarcula sp. GCM10025709]|uniref:FAD-dependent oxidoreductase n=1 Tax=Haloarcula TaxID=2237 RepID=UPI0024C2BECB|nr:NAD(P)/FAD-dependent oxidoreductase [Halomicroarcula sp. YJ-61-S]